MKDKYNENKIFINSVIIFKIRDFYYNKLLLN